MFFISGDKITSITIDFRHIVQEDAATILSYASPYNVQLELIEGKGTLPNVVTQNLSQQQSLTHPLYRSSSQEDLNTIERNARKKLFPNDDNTSYPTLKMDQQQNVQQSPRLPAIKQLPQAHEEHEKKNSLKKFSTMFMDLVEQVPEKFQRASSPGNDGKKGMKFGIRVLPPNVNDKEFGKSPSKVQADNDNNSNMEKIDTIEQVEVLPHPPEAMKRSKNKSVDKLNMNVEKMTIGAAVTETIVEFTRQASINSSGIKRDAAGIPQEMPTEMMQAALTARDNRKVNSIDRKSKGKAPRPPANGENGNDSNETTVTNISIDMTDATMNAGNKLNFSDNFSDAATKKNGINDIEFDHSHQMNSTSTPMKRTLNSTEIQITPDIGKLLEPIYLLYYEK